MKINLLFTILSIVFSITLQQGVLVQAENRIDSMLDSIKQATEDTVSIIEDTTNSALDKQGKSVNLNIENATSNSIINNTKNISSEFKEFKSDLIGIKVKIPSDVVISEEMNYSDVCFNGTAGKCHVVFSYTEPSDIRYFNFKFYDFLLSVEKTDKLIPYGSIKTLKEYVNQQYQSLDPDSVVETKGATLGDLYFPPRLIPAFEFLGDKNMTIDGYPAWQLEYKKIHDSIYLPDDLLYEHSLNTYVDVNNTIYKIRFDPSWETSESETDELYSKYYGKANDLINTIEFITPKPSDIMKPIEPPKPTPSFLE